MPLEAVKDLGFDPQRFRGCGYQAEALSPLDILEGGEHCYPGGQAVPHLQEAKLAKLRDSLSGLTRPPSKSLRGEINV